MKHFYSIKCVDACQMDDNRLGNRETHGENKAISLFSTGLQPSLGFFPGVHILRISFYCYLVGFRIK